MDNVMNRPMFRRRDARDRLNDMAGVQGYQDGGPIESAGIPSIMDQIRASGMSTLTPPMAAAFGLADLFQQPSEAPLSAREKQAAETGSMIRTGLDYGAGALSAAGTGLYGAAADVLSPAFATLGATSLAAELERQSDIAYNIALSNLTKGLSATEGMSAADFDLEPDQFDFAVAKAKADAAKITEVRGSLPAPTGPSGMEMERRDRAARQFPTPAGPSGMEMEARSPRQGFEAVRPTVPGSTTGLPAPKPVEPTGPSGMEMEARKPLITDPAAVAAGLNDPDEGTRERTAADFMQEFMANAPKYEGGDKSMMKAMIGFAIAAGESPNAMSNIANGLQAGAQMFLQDKAAKDEFDRQLQLSAMQYGLGEVAKERELSRTGTSYVASKDMEYRGRKYGPGESVFVLNSDILNGRLPEGAVTEATNDALMNMNVALKEAAQKAYEEQTIDDEDYRATISTLDQAASDYSSSSSLMPLLEASLVRVANGEVTGVNSALTTAMNQAMNAVGLKPEDQYESQEAYKADMEQVSVKLVQDLLGESGKTVSDADRQMVRDLLAIQQGVVSGTIKDPDILMRKIQEVMGALESKKQTALDTYRTYSEGYSGMLAPSGAPLRSLKAERVFNPPQSAQPFRYEIRDGIYTKVYGE